MEQGNVCLMKNFVCCDSTTGIPKTSFKWIQFIHLATLFQNVAPWLFAFRIARDIEDRNFCWSNFDISEFFSFFYKPKIYFFFKTATLLAIAMIPLIAKSTGMHSPLNSPLQRRLRRTPLAAATIMPTGPLRLSTQPGRGS